jgi:UDP-N-acetylglucosamine 4,6-dehydratase
VKQRASGRITITDFRMTRFWLTLEQGVRFVVRCIEQMRGEEVFVPKIPSMRILDVASTIAPGCELAQIGIRPGEKLHEVLLSTDDARHAMDLGDKFVIEPSVPYFPENGRHGEGRPLPDGLSYTSDTNPEWLSETELLRMVGEPALAHA